MQISDATDHTLSRQQLPENWSRAALVELETGGLEWVCHAWGELTSCEGTHERYVPSEPDAVVRFLCLMALFHEATLICWSEGHPGDWRYRVTSWGYRLLEGSDWTLGDLASAVGLEFSIEGQDESNNEDESPYEDPEFENWVYETLLEDEFETVLRDLERAMGDNFLLATLIASRSSPTYPLDDEQYQAAVNGDVTGARLALQHWLAIERSLD